MLKEMLDFFEHSLLFIPNAHFLFITRESQVVQGQILRKKINPDFFTIITLDHAMVPKFLSAADVGLAFYKPGHSRKGCCPTKLGEYLSCGVPIIINSNIGDSDAIVKGENVGVIFNQFNEQEYSKIIHELRELLTEEKELKSRCHMTARKYFSLESGVQTYRQIYRNLSDPQY
jgi:glycosyltransferase involved in cell wall biosynthesis